ncbi:hypothetical protein [Streptomyces sp. P17]|uniref:hypothetical protein n=1 Tax=Streptomyces sp. P17 TaxID=3074716 RepID=UPI0028F3F78C|nr:hypothetical protein [Streptomyces sp. P17]MDT9698627.1 hypothetical protein [Streptomyces sp. P17]
MKNWREDAQPEWPEAASGTKSTPTAEGGVQAFPETAAGKVVSTEADETRVLPKTTAPDGSAAEGRADLTELLSAFDRFDRTAVIPGAGGAGAKEAPRKSRTGGEVFTPRAGARTPAVAAAPREPFPPGGGPRETPPPVRDPWDEPVDSGHTHDPHEVTIQLDGIGLQFDGSLHAVKGGPGGGGAKGSEGPVFVDESGRRSQRFRRLGIVVGIACAVYAVVIVATLLSGNSNAPWLPVQDPKKDTPAGQVDTSPLPAESAPPADTDDVVPGASPSASDGVTPSPGASATAPDGSGTAEDPGTSSDPEPTATKPTTRPGTDTTPDPDPTDTATTPDPEPTETDTGEPTPDPTPTEEPGDTAGTGTDTVALSPVTGPAERPGAAASPHAPSPEYTL